MSRLVIFSNRLPAGDNPSGGLVVALMKTMEAQGGLWIGTAGQPAEDIQSELTPHSGALFERLSMTLTPQEHTDYYLGYSNSVLWPLFHGRPDLLDIRPEFFESYKSTNTRLAALALPHLKDTDTIWIHDYHLIPLASELRKRGVKNNIGFFLHIPFPASAHARTLSHFDTLAEWLGDYDLVGLQTQRDVASALDSFKNVPRAEILLGGRIKIGDKITRISSFPISIDDAAFAKIARSAQTAKKRVLPNEHRLVIGVDRLDYSKGLPQRLRGFERFLASYGAARTKVSLLQIAPASRDTVSAYIDIRKELESLSGEINGIYGQIGYTPVQYLHKPVPREDLAGLYRRASVGLVTPLADGMNLVAKEYVAAQDPEDPGVLILSKLAGAYEQLGVGALGVNPYDASSIAEAIELAISMPLRERIDRYNKMMKVMGASNIDWWTRTFLDNLAEVARRPL